MRGYQPVALAACLSLGVVAATAAPASARRAEPARLGADGGSGTYMVEGATFAFDLVNTGSTSWQYFALIGPTGSTFVGAATAGESTIRCVTAQPDALPNELECGPLSLTGGLPSTQIGLIATMSDAQACGAPFELEVSSTGVLPYTAVGEVTLAGSCAAAPPTSTSSAAGTPPGAAASCGPQRITVAGARSTLASRTRELQALEGPWQVGLAAAAAARTGLARASATPRAKLPPRLASALSGGAGADSEAASALEELARTHFELETLASTARTGLSRAAAALAACAVTPAAPSSSSAATATACPDERAAVASAQAALDVVGDPGSRRAGTRGLAAAKSLEAAIGSLRVALVGTPPSLLTADARAALARLVTTEVVVNGGAERFETYLSSRGAVAGELVRAEAALASCTRS